MSSYQTLQSSLDVAPKNSTISMLPSLCMMTGPKWPPAPQHRGCLCPELLTLICLVDRVALRSPQRNTLYRRLSHPGSWVDDTMSGPRTLEERSRARMHRVGRTQTQMTLIFVPGEGGKERGREGGVEMEMEMEGGVCVWGGDRMETIAAIGEEQWDTNMADIPPPTPPNPLPPGEECRSWPRHPPLSSLASLLSFHGCCVESEREIAREREREREGWREMR